MAAPLCNRGNRSNLGNRGRQKWLRWCVTMPFVWMLAGSVPAADHDTLDIDSIVTIIDLVLDVDPESANQSLAVISSKIQQKELPESTLRQLRQRLADRLSKVVSTRTPATVLAQAASLMASFGDDAACDLCRQLAVDAAISPSDRLTACKALLYLKDQELLQILPKLMGESQAESREFRQRIIAALGTWDDPRIAPILIAHYDQLEADIQTRVIELLTQRASWSKDLLDAISDMRISAMVLNANQVLRLLNSKDEQIVKLVKQKWGTVRSDRNPQREQTIQGVRERLMNDRGEARRGQPVFDKLCGQCHKIYGKGNDVGPDITANGRASFEQLLSNVLDPSLVIGASYQARIIATDDGRVLTGLPVEESDERVVLKVQGGKLETIPRDLIDTYKVSELSMMPEGLENQLSGQELLDLFAFLLLDKPPEDSSGRLIPGTPAIQAGAERKAISDKP